MASFVAKMVSKKILGESLENKYGKEVTDPFLSLIRWKLFEHITNTAAI